MYDDEGDGEIMVRWKMRSGETYEQSYTEEELSDSVIELPDGCLVEPDGRCEHGLRSPLLKLGFL